MAALRISVEFPDAAGPRAEPQAKGERELLSRLRDFGDQTLASYEQIELLEWWTGQHSGHSEALVLYFKMTLQDGVFIKASVSPVMFEELIGDGPLTDFFEHMNREVTMRMDEWRRGVYTPKPPDLLEHVIAFREWKVDWDKQLLQPIGIGGAAWTGPEWQKAECRSRGIVVDAPFGHSAPHPACQCGLYALHQLPEKSPYGSTGRPEKVWGVVQAKGRMEVHSNGIRAEFARPVMLCIPEPTSWVKITPAGAGEQLSAYEPGAVPLEQESAKDIRKLAKDMGLDAVTWSFVQTKAHEYGQPVPPALYPGRN